MSSLDPFSYHEDLGQQDSPLSYVSTNNLSSSSNDGSHNDSSHHEEEDFSQIKEQLLLNLDNDDDRHSQASSKSSASYTSFPFPPNNNDLARQDQQQQQPVDLTPPSSAGFAEEDKRRTKIPHQSPSPHYPKRDVSHNVAIPTIAQTATTTTFKARNAWTPPAPHSPVFQNHNPIPHNFMPSYPAIGQTVPGISHAPPSLYPTDYATPYFPYYGRVPFVADANLWLPHREQEQWHHQRAEATVSNHFRSRSIVGPYPHRHTSSKCCCTLCIDQTASHSVPTSSSRPRKSAKPLTNGRKRKSGASTEKENLTPEQLAELEKREWVNREGYKCRRCGDRRFQRQQDLIDHMVEAHK